MSGLRGKLIVVLAVAAVLVLLFLRGCGGRSGPGGPDAQSTTAPLPTVSARSPSATAEPPVTTVRPRVPGTDEAEQVLAKALRTMYSWEPGADRSPADAYARATPYLTPDLAQPDPNAHPSSKGSSSLWVAWTAKRIRIIPDIRFSCEDCADTPDQIRRAAVVRQTAVAPNGDKALSDTFTLFVALTRQPGGGWRISAITYG